MRTEHEDRTNSDLTVITILVGVALLLLVCFIDALGAYLRAISIMCILLSFVVGFVGKDRNIGFPASFFISLLLSPLIDLIIVLSSSKIKDEAYKEQMLDIAKNKNDASSVADQLHKLNELRKEGVLTDQEFSEQKEKLLNSW
jgi:hypothetical protein